MSLGVFTKPGIRGTADIYPARVVANTVLIDAYNLTEALCPAFFIATNYAQFFFDVGTAASATAPGVIFVVYTKLAVADTVFTGTGITFTIATGVVFPYATAPIYVGRGYHKLVCGDVCLTGAGAAVGLLVKSV